MLLIFAIVLCSVYPTSLFRSSKNQTGVSNSSAVVIFAINTVRGSNISLHRESVIVFHSAIYDVTCEEVSR